MGNEAFQIRNDYHADNVLEEISRLKKEIRQKEELAEKRIQQIEQWKKSEVEKLEGRINWLTDALESYFRKLRESNPKLKTHSLPFGKLQIRKQQPKWKYDDNKLLESVKKTLPEVIKIKEEVDKIELKKRVKLVNNTPINPDTGEVIEGIVIEERPEKFSIKVEGAE